MNIPLAIMVIVGAMATAAVAGDEIGLAASVNPFQSAILSSVITQELVDMLEDSPRNVMITMKDSPDDILTSFASRAFGSRGEKLTAIQTELEQRAVSTQAPILSLLGTLQPLFMLTSPFTFNSYWISNQIFVEQANSALMSTLLTNCGDIIGLIEQEKIAFIGEPLDFHLMEGPNAIQNSTVQWGVNQTDAPKVWAKNNTGQGIVVGFSDTGVRGSHETVVKNFFGQYGWYDPKTKSRTSSDNVGHGTHVASTAVGGYGVGVAPGAKWMACKGCGPSSCTQSVLTACGEFFACPLTTDGKTKDCSKAPHIVSHSWGGGQGQTFYDAVINAYHAMRIIPIFSIGNSGSGCGTANSPGDNVRVIGVGATNEDKTLAYYSSKGPSVFKGIKPEIVGPGSLITAASNAGDTKYATLSGTSMAAPHVAGTVALMLSANPNLNYDQILSYLQQGAVQLTPIGDNCGGIPDATRPNNGWGYGRINAFNSISLLSSP